jgi:hypothetical protein
MGKPSKGTPRDMRLKENRQAAGKATRPAPKPKPKG